MDPRHKLYKTLDKLAVDSEDPDTMQGVEATQVPASSGVTPEAIKTKLETELSATWVEIEDMSGTFRSLLTVDSSS
jgi:hypothetical protein